MIFAALVGTMALALTGCGAVENCDTKPTLSSVEHDQLAQGLAEVVNVPRLAWDFVDNNPAGERKYGNRPIIIRGQVQSVIGSQEPFAVLASDVTTVQAQLASVDDAAKLKEGSGVMLYCSSVGRGDSMTIRAENCDIIGAS